MIVPGNWQDSISQRSRWWLGETIGVGKLWDDIVNLSSEFWDESLVVVVLYLVGDFLCMLISGLRIAMLVFMYGTDDVGWRVRSWVQRRVETGTFYTAPWLFLGSPSVAIHPVSIMDHDTNRRDLLAK